MITVQSVQFSFRHFGDEHRVLDSISFHIARHDSCVIIGPSGCGKTSLLFLLAGLLKPNKGSITFAEDIRRGMILQNYGLLPWKTVAENIGLGLTLQHAPKKEIAAKVEQFLTEMGLSGFADNFPGQLSGGMQQRVAIARALALEPQALFMDEPLSSLDALTRERLQNFILAIRLQKSITTIMVTHSIEEAVFLGTHIVVLSSRPAKILSIVENPSSGMPHYRQSEKFYHQCNAIRNLLATEDNG